MELVMDMVHHVINFIIKKNIIVRNTFNKKAKDWYTESCKTFLKEIKEDTNGKTFLVYGLEDLILIRCQ